MMQFYLMRESLRDFYGRHALYLTPIIRFVTALTALLLMDWNMGYAGSLGSIPVVLGVALICGFLPWGGMTLALSVCLLYQFLSVSMEVFAIGLIVFFFIWIMHMVLLPEGRFSVVLIPILFCFDIPYVVPVLVALGGTLTGIAPVSFGVVVYYLIRTVIDSAPVLTGGGTLNILQRFLQVLTALRDNKVMYVMLAAFAAIYLIVYLIRQMSVDYSRTIGIVTGTVTGALVLLLGELALQIDFRTLSITSIVVGTLLSGVIAVLLDFFIFAVDYNRTEYVQFEDDDYYYYVKAVPKIAVTAPDKQVKKINTRTAKRPQPEHTGRREVPTDEFWK